MSVGRGGLIFFFGAEIPTRKSALPLEVHTEHRLSKFLGVAKVGPYYSPFASSYLPITYFSELIS